MERKYWDETAHIYLRYMNPEDTDRIVAWRNQKDIRESSFSQNPFTREGHLNWVREMVDTGKVVQMVICLEESDEPIGCVYLRNIDRQNRKAEYGIYIGEGSFRGKGIGTSAARLMLRYGFSELCLHRIYLLAYADNLQAVKSYEKAGFSKEACMRDDIFVNGRFRDVVLMAILNPAEA